MAFSKFQASRPIHLKNDQIESKADLSALRNRVEELEQENQRLVEFYEGALRESESESKIDARSDAALRQSEERFRMSFESGVVGNIVIDDHGIIEEANSQVEAIFGYTTNELIGRNVKILMPEPNAEHHNDYISAYLKTNKSKIIGAGRELTGRRKDGAEFPMLLGIGEMLLGDRRSFIGSVTDLTEVKTLEAKLLHSQKLEAVGQLTSGVSHDFNNLLAVTMANGQLLANELMGNPKLYAMANSIVSASKRGAELTHRLLAFSRQQPLHPNTLQLGALCEGMSTLLRRTLGENISIDIATESNVWSVSVDAGQLENALLNLAINASHAMPDGGMLDIKISNTVVVNREWVEFWDGQPGEYVTLRVSDTGTGMPENVLQRVFEPFFTTKENDQGSGLGLSMVHGFAKQSGGFVTVESVEGDGATVTIYLPKDRSAPSGRLSKLDDVELFKGRGETILLVEDEAAVRRSSAQLLTMLGYEVLIAQDGETALGIAAKTGNIDILVSDMVLPGYMNGVEIFQQIVRQRPGIKCIFVSGYAAMADARLPRDTELLLKPYQMHVLAKKLRQLLAA